MMPTCLNAPEPSLATSLPGVDSMIVHGQPLSPFDRAENFARHLFRSLVTSESADLAEPS
jgi:hypothetical protein